MAEEAPEVRPRGPKLRKREAERVRRVRRQQFALVGAVGAVVVVAVLLAAMYKPVTTVGCQAHQVCDSTQAMHIHPRIYIYNGEASIPIPSCIGNLNAPCNGPYADHTLDHFLDLREGTLGTLAPIHTHDASGYIHVEARVIRAFTLGEFFDIWGKPLGPTQAWDFVADAGHKITLTVNGAPNTQWGELVLQDNQVVELRYVTL